MFMILFMFKDLIDDFFEILNDILSLNAPKPQNSMKLPKPLGR